MAFHTADNQEHLLELALLRGKVQLELTRLVMVGVETVPTPQDLVVEEWVFL
jgi:hypothetical protein